MTDELRDRIAVVLFDKERDLEDANDYVDWVRVVNAVRQEITAAGYVIVEARASHSIEVITDTERNCQDVMVNGCQYMRVYEDGTIEGYAGTIGDTEFVNGQTFPLRTQEYMDWVTERASKNPALPVQ
jgi:hypothetical protein